MEFEPGEEVFFCGHPSWRSLGVLYARGVIAALAVGVLAGLLSRVVDGHVDAVWVTLAVIAVLAVVVAAGQLRRIQTTYAITDRRLTIETGLLSRDLHQTRLERIQNVSARQSLAERVLGIGTVDFDTAGEARFDFAFRGVGEPRRIVRTVDRALHELRHASAPPADV